MNFFVKKNPSKDAILFINLFFHSFHITIIALPSSNSLPPLLPPLLLRESDTSLGYHPALGHQVAGGLEKNAILGNFIFPSISVTPSPYVSQGFLRFIIQETI